MSLVSADRLRTPGAAPGRTCGDCTACCTLLAITELHKPMRRACDHVGRDGCRIHPTRPASCRLFHCVWLRGALGDDDRTRPDHLGVMVDHFVERATGEAHTLAFELWPGAFASPEARAVLDALAQQGPVALAWRDGRWSAWPDDEAP